MKLNKKLYVSLYILCLMIETIPIFFLTSPIVEDGLGTMASAAYLTGQNWSQFLAQEGYFYKYGQAVWYIIPFIIGSNPVIRYRLMLFINAILVSFIGPIAAYIAIKYLKLDRKISGFIALASAFFPAVTLYSKYTWAESVLCLLPWLVILLLCELLRMDGRKADRYKLYSALLAAVAVYDFMSHQRGIIMVIAVVWVVLLADRNRQISRKAFFLTLVMCLVIDRVFNYLTKYYAYGNCELQHNTMSDFLRPEVYEKLLSFKGMAVLIRTIMGWVFHSASSTCGLAIIALNVCLVIVLRWLFTRDRGRLGFGSIDGLLTAVTMELLLLYMGSMALGVMFFFVGQYGYWFEGGRDRADHLIFGRYLESLLAPLCFVGLCYLAGIRRGTFNREEKWNNRLLIISIAEVAGMIAYYAFRIMPIMDGTKVYVHSLMSIGLFMDMSGVTTTYDYVPGIGRACLLYALLALVMMIVIAALGRVGRLKAVCVIVISLFLIVYAYNAKEVQVRVDRACETVYAQYYLENT